jgi:hypothetical protein
MDKIRKSANGKFSPGTKRFEDEISQMLDRRVSRGKAGKLRKKNLQGNFLGGWTVENLGACSRNDSQDKDQY